MISNQKVPVPFSFWNAGARLGWGGERAGTCMLFSPQVIKVGVGGCKMVQNRSKYVP